MEQQLQLVKPAQEYYDEYVSFYEEWKNSKEPIVPWVVDKEPYDFAAYLHFLESEVDENILPADFVPHTTYWLRREDGRIVGAVNIRHRLNDRLLRVGGHIGYGIRPSERQKGYATAILAMSLDITRELGLKKVLVVCDSWNTASEKTILKNGGVLESDYTEEDGNVVRRYWIEL